MLEVESKGLLLQFIKEKEKNYLEPTRKGTPRGEIIGFSLRKYKATLLMLTSMNLMQLSKRLGVSYGLLRKWRTEPLFKKQIEDHIREFVPIFIGSLFRKLIEEDNGFSQYYKVAIIDAAMLHGGYELKNYDSYLLIEDEPKSYSSGLKETLIEKLLTFGKDYPFLFMFLPFVKTCRSLAYEERSRRRLLFPILNQQQKIDEEIVSSTERATLLLKNRKGSEDKINSAQESMKEAKELALKHEEITQEVKKILKELK